MIDQILEKKPGQVLRSEITFVSHADSALKSVKLTVTNMSSTNSV